MYFVAKILSSNTIVVVPKKWVFGIENHWERMVNNGINKNNSFLCFYSEKPDALDAQGRPNEEYIPDWEDFLWENKTFPEQGCYKMNILHSTGK